mmetsp:Transcript_29128/g.38075  ORF Transcript_29128/g.38075 Transcript_29128/m.38075 type:complete len:140 (-) Transcript_29128:9-428(-)
MPVSSFRLLLTEILEDVRDDVSSIMSRGIGGLELLFLMEAMLALELFIETILREVEPRYLSPLETLSSSIKPNFSASLLLLLDTSPSASILSARRFLAAVREPTSLLFREGILSDESALEDGTGGSLCAAPQLFRLRSA